MPDKAKAVRCLFNVIDLPPERFGTGPAAMTRRMVLIAIARNANADGSNAWPSLTTIAHRCCTSERTVRRTIAWLIEHGLLKVERRLGLVNHYTVIADAADTLDTRCPDPVDEDKAPTTDNRCPGLGMDTTDNLAPYHGHNGVRTRPDISRGDPGHQMSNDRPTVHIPSHIQTEKTETVHRVWDYYVERLGKNPKIVSFSKARQKKGLNCLDECLKKGGTLENAEGLMKLAIDALAASSFHMGKNDKGMRFDSWERHLFPTSERLEEWLERADRL